MTLGAVTLVESFAAQGPVFYDRVTIVGDDSYPTGGTPGAEALIQAAIGENKEIIDLQMEQGQGGTVIDNDLHYDHATDTLVATVRSTAAQVANTTNMSGSTFSALVVSR